MTPDDRLLLYALGAIVALVLLIARWKVHPFIALVGVSLTMGLVAGMGPAATVKAFSDGVGGVLAFIAVVVGLGTMLGKIMAESGAATRIATTLIAQFGERRVHWAIMVVAFIVGMPVFFQVGFVLLVPLVFTIARRAGVSLVKVGISLVAGLSVVHGMLPPHPAAMLAVGAYGADLGRSILYGIIVGLPTAALAGPLFAAWVAPRIVLPAHNPMASQLEGSAETDMPGFAMSVFTVLLPVILIIAGMNAIVALLVALVFSFWSLGRARRLTRDQLLKFCNDCLAPTAAILLVIGAGGGFNQVLVQSGVGRAIADIARGLNVSPLILAWTVATMIRVATGSATVAMTTAAGIVAPIAASVPGTSPELLVLATGAGSLMLSHVNDAGFWLIKEYFNMTVQQTLRTWTVTETIIGVAGLGFVLLLSMAPLPAKSAQQSAPASEWIDASAALDPATTPVYEGDPPMKFTFVKDMRKGDPLTLSSLTLGAHSGTHVDAPMHFLRDGSPVDRIPLDVFVGPARVIEVPDRIEAIDAAELNRHNWRGAQRVLFRTRSSAGRWMSSPNFHRDFTYITPEAAQLLADGGVRLVGVDYLSSEKFGSAEPLTHRILLGKGIPIVEGLSLERVPAGEYELVVLPIKVAGHEGAPARAIVRKRS